MNLKECVCIGNAMNIKRFSYRSTAHVFMPDLNNDESPVNITCLIIRCKHISYKYRYSI